MSVALVAPNLHPAGAERQMALLAMGLPKDRFAVRFILLSERGAFADEVGRDGIPVHTLSLRREECRRSRIRCLRAAWASVLEYRRLTRDVDIVDGWTVPAFIFAGIARWIAPVPVVMAGRRSMPDGYRTRSRARDLLRRLAMARVDAVVANSRAAADAAIRVEGLEPRRMHVIPNAVIRFPVSEEDRRRIRASWDVADDHLALGCIGTLQPGKGHALLIDVAAALHASHPDLRWVFIGDGPIRDELRARIEAAGLVGIVTITGEVPDARPLYGALDIAVQASVSEGLPNAVLEAAAAARPIVATDVGGTREIVTDEQDGLLVPAGDATAMRDAILRMVDGADLRARLGVAAGQRAEAFSVAALVDRTAALYLELLGR